MVEIEYSGLHIFVKRDAFGTRATAEIGSSKVTCHGETAERALGMLGQVIDAVHAAADDVQATVDAGPVSDVRELR